MKYLLISALLLSSTQAFSWGKNGHRIVGEVAMKNLTKKTKKAIAKIAGKDFDLAKHSTWADEIKSDHSWKHANPWHYVSIPDGKTYFEITKAEGGDAIEACFRFEKVLRDKKASQKDKLEALKFLNHIIGDIHQPLHVGYQHDLGGNKKKVKWFKEKTNLHAVWDTHLIEFEKLSFTEYVRFFDKGFDKKKLMSGNCVDWAVESQQVRKQAYDYGGDRLSYSYQFKNKDLLNRRLIEGGLRLAYRLNLIFEGKDWTPEDKKILPKVIRK